MRTVFPPKDLFQQWLGSWRGQWCGHFRGRPLGPTAHIWAEIHLHSLKLVSCNSTHFVMGLREREREKSGIEVNFLNFYMFSNGADRRYADLKHISCSCTHLAMAHAVFLFHLSDSNIITKSMGAQFHFIIVVVSSQR